LSPGAQEPVELLDAAAAGDRVALARLLSLVERGGAPSAAVARLAYGAPPPYTVGITGAPGAGKSTLTNALVAVARRGWPPDGGDADGGEPDGGEAEPAGAERRAGPAGEAQREPREERGNGTAGEAVDQVGVLAVDPSSPFSGGAILGDRIRMQDHATDPSVFIRSMATRGHLGGLALAVPDAVRVLGAAGLPLVVVETVGVGQMEVDVASAADTTVVVVTPGWGDSMQANKAGLLEVADLFVVNKADRQGVREARRDLEQMLELSPPGGWRPPIVATVATDGEGVDELWAAIARHRAHLRSTGALETRRRSRLAEELRRVLTARVLERVGAVAAGASFEAAVRDVTSGALDPYRAADQLLEGRLPDPVPDPAPDPVPDPAPHPVRP
jgi:LAO/AO transport system kinase